MNNQYNTAKMTFGLGVKLHYSLIKRAFQRCKNAITRLTLNVMATSYSGKKKRFKLKPVRFLYARNGVNVINSTHEAFDMKHTYIIFSLNLLLRSLYQHLQSKQAFESNRNKSFETR